MIAHACSTELSAERFEVAACSCSLVPDACGDQHAVWQDDLGNALFAVVDGLGHGPLAAEAALTAIDALRDPRGMELSRRLQLCHAALQGTRGAAVMVASHDPHESNLHLMGVGNVGVTMFRRATAERSTVMGMPGIVGHRLPKQLRESRREIRPGDTLVIATDGVGPFIPVGETAQLAPLSVAHSILGASTTIDDALVLVARLLA
ncbi:MAG: conserved hypothetical regulatory protein [Thermoleophilia bacterium]|nr:conserved hypothetical regulatory protein [Thermoleophilia bacterium]